jgi:hypothetical protein
MVKLNFESFHDYKAKLHQYLKNNDLTDQFQKTHLDGLKIMIDAFDMDRPEDVRQVAFLLWMFQDDFVKLLNSGHLLSKIDLDSFKKFILTTYPSIHLGDCIGLTPLGGFTATLTDTVGYYDCIKFIGQFTDCQDVYDQCLEILEALPIKLEGLLMDPPDIMYLMTYNSNETINTSKNRYKVKPNQNINKRQSLKHSAWRIDPSHEHQFNRYLMDFHEVCYAMTQSASTNNDIKYICLINHMIKSHYSIINDTDLIKNFYANLSDLPFDKLENIIIQIDQTILESEQKLNSEAILESEQKLNSEAIINSTMKILDKTDETEMISIGIDACVYQDEELKRDLLIALYERKLADPNSRFSHNLLRNAVKSGCLWLTKFLIEQGVPTRKIPTYNTSPWNIQSQQLYEILNDGLKECHKKNEAWIYGPEWAREKTKKREAVKKYLILIGAITIDDLCGD